MASIHDAVPNLDALNLDVNTRMLVLVASKTIAFNINAPMFYLPTVQIEKL